MIIDEKKVEKTKEMEQETWCKFLKDRFEGQITKNEAYKFLTVHPNHRETVLEGREIFISQKKVKEYEKAIAQRVEESDCASALAGGFYQLIIGDPENALESEYKLYLTFKNPLDLPEHFETIISLLKENNFNGLGKCFAKGEDAYRRMETVVLYGPDVFLASIVLGDVLETELLCTEFGYDFGKRSYNLDLAAEIAGL